MIFNLKALLAFLEFCSKFLWDRHSVWQVKLAVAATISTTHQWECQQYAIDSQPSTRVIQDLFRLFIAQRGLEKLEACWWPWESWEHQQQQTWRWPGSILGFDSTGKKSHVAGGCEGTCQGGADFFVLRLLPTEKRGRSEFRKFKQRTWQQMNYMIHTNHWIDSYHEMWWNIRIPNSFICTTGRELQTPCERKWLGISKGSRRFTGVTRRMNLDVWRL